MRFNATAAVVQDQPTPGFTPVVVPPGKAKPKLDFGGIKKKEAVASPKSEYPVLPDPDGILAQQAAAFLEAQAAEEAAKGAKEAARSVLISAARPFHFTINSGRSDIPSSVSVPSPKGEVRVTFKDSYKKLDDTKFERVKEIIGEDLAANCLVQSFEFTIKSDKIPLSKMQAVIDAISELSDRLAIGDAVQVAACYTPTAEWHVTRFRHLTPEQNLQLEAAVDPEKGFCQAAVGIARGGRK